MDILITVVLPLSLAVIMFSLGVGLTFSDFFRVFNAPKAFVIGAVSQVLLLPMVTLLTVLSFDLSAEIAVGFMLLSFCPGGVTSNMLSRLARGDVALSVSLTAIISLLSILTVPILSAWAVVHFMGDAAPDVSVTSLATAMFLITTLPVLVGLLFRHFAPEVAVRMEPVLTGIATALFMTIVSVALAGNWGLFVENVYTLGSALIILNAALLFIGLGFARTSGLAWTQAKTISIETGVQNATLGITLAALILPQAEGFSALALPSAVYGITMYLVAAPFLAWYRST
ncbi:bile acid:sodium symporter family protein [Tateyamaria pelophila]|uniref:bile acid:sodium symporter family protein n=1 Tax=Tateyamaria pelophila TaxID=328415 RepID=UPI001CBD3AF6|nr:bile acid:sodium symporter family protein [Tateyamaria pelophila]